MAIRDFMGIEIPAFKRFYKDSKKTNTTMKDRCYWAEKENAAIYKAIQEKVMKEVEGAKNA